MGTRTAKERPWGQDAGPLGQMAALLADTMHERRVCGWNAPEPWTGIVLPTLYLLLPDTALMATEWVRRVLGSTQETLGRITAYYAAQGIHTAQDLASWVQAGAAQDSRL